MRARGFRRGRWLRTVVACSALLLPASLRATAAAPPRCRAVAYSPGFAKDRVLFCAVPDAGSSSAQLLRSADGGRTWTRGASFDTPQGNVSAVALAPDYPADRSVYVTADSGVWASHDDGRTAKNVSQQGATGRTITPFRSGVTTPAGTVGAHHEVAIVNGSVVDASVYDARTAVTRTVVGGPMQNWHFVVPPDYPARPAIALSYDIGSHVMGQTINQNGMYAYECTGDFQCARRLTFLGEGFTALDARPLAGGAHYVSGFDADGLAEVFRSPDYGRSWARWKPVENVVRSAYGKAEVFLHLTITASPDVPRRLWLNLGIEAAGEPRTNAPAFQLWRSEDGGTHWTRTGVAWGTRQRVRGRDTLPWNTVMPDRIGRDAYVSAAPGGALLVVGAHRTAKGVDREGLYCSRDLGKSWRPSCF
jgi:hypothetical protein